MKEEKGKIKLTGGAICGGTIKESEFMRRVKNNTVEGVMMSWVLPDKWYKKYLEADEKKAHQIFMKHAWSLI
jgi:hypothetical protein